MGLLLRHAHEYASYAVFTNAIGVAPYPEHAGHIPAKYSSSMRAASASLDALWHSLHLVSAFVVLNSADNSPPPPYISECRRVRPLSRTSCRCKSLFFSVGVPTSTEWLFSVGVAHMCLQLSRMPTLRVEHSSCPGGHPVHQAGGAPQGVQGGRGCPH